MKDYANYLYKKKDYKKLDHELKALAPDKEFSISIAKSIIKKECEYYEEEKRQPKKEYVELRQEAPKNSEEDIRKQAEINAERMAAVIKAVGLDKFTSLSEDIGDIKKQRSSMQSNIND